MTFQEPDGATPLDADERQGLKYNHITTRGELDELEQANIEQGLAWAERRRSFDVFDDVAVRKLHKELFGDVWNWAGEYRKTEKTSALTPSRFPCNCGCCSTTPVTGPKRQSFRRLKPHRGSTTEWCRYTLSRTGMAAMLASLRT